jgi:hypothetical protein
MFFTDFPERSKRAGTGFCRDNEKWSYFTTRKM